MRVFPPAAGTRQATLRPMRAGLARMVAALRGVVAVLAVAAAVVGAVPPVSWAWLGPALALVLCWTPAYIALAWTKGLRPWLVAADLAVAAALSLAVGRLIPASQPSMLGWVASLVSMSLVSSQLGGAPLLSVPAGLLVAASYLTGQQLAGSPDHGMTALLIMVVQVLAAAAVTAVAMRVERDAIRSFLRLQETEAAAALAQARREAERAQLRAVHNGPLTVLTMALHAGAAGQAGPAATLRRRAGAVLTALPALAAEQAAADGATARLDERLSQVMVWYSPLLRITADLPPVTVPAVVAEALAAAASEAMENAVRHAGSDHVTVALVERAGTVRVTVTDDGRGFDPVTVAAAGKGFGLREDLVGRMAAAGGTVVMRSRPGAGTAVELEWRRG